MEVQHIKAQRGRKPKAVENSNEKKLKQKRPASAYILFSKDIRPTIVKENPTMKSKEIVKMIAAKWKIMNENEKKKYQEMHLLAKKEYEEKMNQNENE